MSSTLFSRLIAPVHLTQSTASSASFPTATLTRTSHAKSHRCLSFQNTAKVVRKSAIPTWMWMASRENPAASTMGSLISCHRIQGAYSNVSSSIWKRWTAQTTLPRLSRICVEPRSRFFGDTDDRIRAPPLPLLCLLVWPLPSGTSPRSPSRSQPSHEKVGWNRGARPILAASTKRAPRLQRQSDPLEHVLKPRRSDADRTAASAIGRDL